MDLGSAESAKLLKSFMLKGEGEGVGTKDNAGVVEMLVGLPLWTCLDLVELLCRVELSKCFCIWSDRKDMVGI